MFDQFNGMPMHVLLVHAAVVFVPLLGLLAVVYALVPRVRDRVGWAVALLAGGAPAAALVAMFSGNAFKQRLLEQGMNAEGLAPITTHQGYGELTFWCSLALGVVTGALILLTGRGARRPSAPPAVELALSVLIVALAATSSYFVFMTGDTGAASVWGA